MERLAVEVVEEDEGHALVRLAEIDEAADELSFLFHELGVPFPPLVK